MVEVEQIDTSIKKQVHRFVEVPFRLYKDTPQWVPPIRIDVENTLNRKKHPFYEHSQADFFIARQGSEDVGRIAVLVNNHYNEYHHTKRAQFYFYECMDDQDVANALFERAFEWARQRGLTEIIGPKGFAVLDGYGMLVDGFEHRQMMTMMNYNHAYNVTQVEKLGFEKEVDFLSCYVETAKFKIPERVHSIAQRVQQRGTLRVLRFKNKKELIAWADRIGKTYNEAFVNNWEYVPLTQREIDFTVDNLMTVANPKLIKIIAHGDDAVGFLFGFPDVSAALQRNKGRLLPFGIFDLLIELRRSEWISVNGAGVLPEFQGRGGNALMYVEMEDTASQFHFKYAEMTQVAESAVDMRRDLISLGGIPYKNHRVYRRSL